MAFACLHFLEAHGRIGRDRENHVVHFRETRFPVLLVGVVADLRVFLVTFQHEWAGADWVLVELGKLAFLVQLLCIFGRQDGERRHGDLDDQIGVGLFQRHLDGVIVHLLDLGHVFGQARIDCIRKLGRMGFAICIFGVEHAVKRKDHVVCVEVTCWRKGLGGVELHALTQAKGIRQAVFGNIPFFSQRRLHIGCPVDETHQRVVNGMAAGIKRAATGIHAGIKTFGAGFRTIHQRFACRCSCRRRCTGTTGGSCRRGRLAASAQSGYSQYGKRQCRFRKHAICHERVSSNKTTSAQPSLGATAQCPKNPAGKYL